MEKLAALGFVWALIFAMLFLPARKAGTWIAGRVDGLAGAIQSIGRCFVLAWSVVFLVWLALRIGGREIFPHVNADYFGPSYVAALLFAPAFAALIAGYLHARMVAGRRTLRSCLPAKFRDLLADLFLLALSVAFLGLGGRSLLKLYYTWQIYARYPNVTYSADTKHFCF
jgi:hypothetical protein